MLFVCTEAAAFANIEKYFLFDKLPFVHFASPDDLIGAFGGLQAWPPVPVEEFVRSSCDFGYSESLESFLTFDFGRDYPHPLLFHSGRGGGFGLDLLSHLHLRPSIAGAVRERLKSLPVAYDAIQIRNTDIKSDYNSLLALKTLHSSSCPLLVCSDDDNAILQVREALSGFRRVLTLRPLSCLENQPGLPLHYDSSLSPFEKNLAVLIDLFAISFARKLFVAKIFGGGLSGFALLAKSLNLRPWLARRILVF